MAHKGKVVGILGGGVSGLSAAYYLSNKFGNLVKPIILEKSGRCGGWIRTVVRTDGNRSHYYEMGPRTVRVAGINSMNTLDLVEEIGLAGHLNYIKYDHPAANRRFVYLNEKLVQLPVDMSPIFMKKKPFTKPLIFHGLKDLLTPRQRMEDDTIYNFVKRRFGADMADYVIDAVIRGICAGDSKEITVKLLMKNLFESEQKHGSALVGTLLNLFKKDKENKEEKAIGYSNVALAGLRERWLAWTLEGGLENLPRQIENFISENTNVEIKKNCTIDMLKFDQNNSNKIDVDCKVNGSPETFKCDYVISTIPAVQLASLFHKSPSLPSYSSLSSLLETIRGVDVCVTCVMYDDSEILKEYGFGFLVPSIEKSVSGLLGVVFDTCCFPQDDKTILTVMSKPSDDANGNETQALQYLQKTLNISTSPSDVHSEFHKSCIAQYTLGHYERVDKIREEIRNAKLPLCIAGSSYDGVGVNDSIFSAKVAAENLEIE